MKVMDEVERKRTDEDGASRPTSPNKRSTSHMHRLNRVFFHDGLRGKFSGTWCGR